MLFPDTVNLISTTINPETGTPTEASGANMAAYWEEESKIKYGADGKPLAPAIWLFFPSTTVVKKGDRVVLVEKAGYSLPAQYQIEREILRADPIGGSHPSHWECQL